MLKSRVYTKKENAHESPLVSVIIRTCQRPDILRKTLDSIRSQTYQNIQTIVVEDGKNTAEQLLKEEYSDLNYIYESMGKMTGRSAAGNRALELSEGEYLNFLDDDDSFLPEHVESLLEKLSASSCLAAYSLAEERQIQVISQSPYKYRIKHQTVRFRQQFNRLLLYAFNYMPIQSVMFHRCLYEELGGFDAGLDALEDWDLWVRYSLVTDFLYVDNVTSIYHVPYGKRPGRRRAEKMRDYLPPVYDKFQSYEIKLNAGEIHKEMLYVIREYKNKGALRYLRAFFRFVFYGER